MAQRLDLLCGSDRCFHCRIQIRDRPLCSRRRFHGAYAYGRRDRRIEFTVAVIGAGVDELGKDIGVSIKCQMEAIFDSMHRI